MVCLLDKDLGEKIRDRLWFDKLPMT